MNFSGFWNETSADVLQETQTGIVRVEESAAVMDVAFRHLYKMELPFTPFKKDQEDVLRAKGTGDNFFLALDVLAAADKVSPLQ